MNVSNFKNIDELKAAFPDEQSCVTHLERLRWQHGVVSPFDKDSIVYKKNPHGQYRCSNTRKYFNVKTGTIFENTKMPLQKWFMAIYIFSNNSGISSVQLGKEILMGQKTAFCLLRKLRYAFNHKLFKQNFLDGDDITELYHSKMSDMYLYERKLALTEGRKRIPIKNKLAEIYKWLNNLTDNQKLIIEQEFITVTSKV